MAKKDVFGLFLIFTAMMIFGLLVIMMASDADAELKPNNTTSPEMAQEYEDAQMMRQPLIYGIIGIMVVVMGIMLLIVIGKFMKIIRVRI